MSLNYSPEFREWLDKQEKLVHKSKSDEKTENYQVECRLGSMHLIKNIKLHNPELEDAENLATEFKDHGGKVISEQYLKVTILVNERQFILPTLYVKRK